MGWGGGKATLDSCPPHLHHGESISPSASVLWSCNKALFVHLYFRVFRKSDFSGFFFEGGAPKSLQMVAAAMKLKDAYSLEGKL